MQNRIKSVQHIQKQIFLMYIFPKLVCISQTCVLKLRMAQWVLLIFEVFFWRILLPSLWIGVGSRALTFVLPDFFLWFLPHWVNSERSCDKLKTASFHLNNSYKGVRVSSPEKHSSLPLAEANQGCFSNHLWLFAGLWESKEWVGHDRAVQSPRALSSCAAAIQLFLCSLLSLSPSKHELAQFSHLWSPFWLSCNRNWWFQWFWSCRICL